MRRRILSILVVSVFMLAGAAVWAEEATTPSGPPSVLVIQREEIKPGHMTVHDRSAAGFVSILNRAGGEYRLGLVPLSGDDNQVVYLAGHRSFADLEASHNTFDQAMLANAALRAEFESIERQGAEQHTTQKTSIGRYRSDLSYRPATAEQWAQGRFIGMAITRVKMGHGADYVEYVKQLNAARQKAGITDLSSTIYQVVSGGTVGTYINFVLFKSLKEFDDNFARMESRDKAVEEALGGETVVKQRRAVLAESVADTSLFLYAYRPEISRPSPQFAAMDPGFWNVKAPKAPAKALAMKKKSTQ